MIRYAIAAALLSTTLSAQQGPPPEIRQLLDGLVQALNGDAAAFEAFARQRFAPAFLEGRSAEDRAELHRRLKDDFGTIAVQRVDRQGPDAPLLVHVRGTREPGVITLELAPGTATIAGMRVTLGDAPSDRPGDGVPPPPVDGRLPSSAIDARLKAYFSKLAADDVFSGVALVARNGVPVFLEAYGFADREKRITNTIHTRFNLGSINKSFTQVAIRQLVQAGTLRYTDTLGTFFPEYPQALSRPATVEQLLTHRAGLADFFGPEFDKAPKGRFASNADYFALVASLPPRFAPGERTAYCNGCYIALGAIVEKVSGLPYERYVAEHVFARAGMTSTGYPRSDRPEPDIALGYTRQGPRPPGPPDAKTSGPRDLGINTALHGVTGSAAGGGYATALDLLAYVKAVRAGTFPGAEQDMGIAGGAPGINAVVEARGEWAVIVLTNLDPPTGERLGVSLAEALSR